MENIGKLIPPWTIDELKQYSLRRKARVTFDQSKLLRLRVIANITDLSFLSLLKVNVARTIGILRNE